MEKGEGSSSCSRGRPKRQYIRTTEAITYEKSVAQLSSDGRNTHLVLEGKRKRPLNSTTGACSTFYDNTSSQYSWLRNGWLVEERRVVLTGRLYRYYYDPMGQMYNTRYAVEQMWADLDKYKAKKNRGAIVID